MIVLSVVNEDGFISTFPPYTSSFLLEVWSVPLRTMLKGSSDSRHSYLMPNPEGNVSEFLTQVYNDR